MAFIFQGYRGRIAMRMAKGDKAIKQWLNTATFAKTCNGYWLAWHKGDNVDKVAFLTPNHSTDEGCRWLDSFDKNDTIDTAIDYFESGKFEADEEEYPNGFVFNLFIQNPETGEWE